MSYHHLFDHLGRPVNSSLSSSRRQPSAMHRLIRWLSAAVIVASLFMLVWGR